MERGIHAYQDKETGELVTRPYTGAEQAAFEARLANNKGGLIKKEANRRILGQSVQHDQRNKVARGVELLSKQVDAIIAHLGIPDPLSASEMAEKEAYLALWANIKSLRAKSNEIEGRPDLATIDIADDQYWT